MVALVSTLLVHSYAVGVQAVPDQPRGEYRAGNVVGWTLTAPEAGTYDLSLRLNNRTEIQRRTVELGPTPVRVEARVSEPAMVFLRLTPKSGKPSDFGAAVSPERLRPVTPRPRDFDAFWDARMKELRKVPMNPVVVPTASPTPAVEMSLVTMDHVGGTKVYSQMARPKLPGKYPAILQLQWAGGPYRLDPWWIAGRAAQGFVILNVQPHNVPAHAEPAFYDALPASVKNYTGQGAKYFVEMYLRGIRAVDYLVKDPNWDGKTLIVLGTSMGGQQAFAVAGLHRRVTHMMVNVPAGCDLTSEAQGRQVGYPFLPNDPLSPYIDGMHFAPRIRAKALVGNGYVDDVCPPAGIWTAFNLLRGPKEMVAMFDSPHNHLATAEQQRPWNERSEAWFAELRGAGAGR